MKLSPILTQDGRPIFSAGGSESYKTAIHKGFVVSLEWVGNGKKSLPCMVIWPETKVMVVGEGQGMWCITRRAITEFVKSSHDGEHPHAPTEHCIKEAKLAMRTLGKEDNDQRELTALVDAVMTFTTELLQMPASPRLTKKAPAAVAA